MKIRANNEKLKLLLLSFMLGISLNAQSITKKEVCDMIDSFSNGQLVVNKLDNNNFTINTYNGIVLNKYDNLDEFDKWGVECYNEDVKKRNIISNGKIIEKHKLSVGGYWIVIFKLDNCTLETLSNGNSYVATEAPICMP